MPFRKPKIPGTALITGASAGIGAELARIFAARGHDVILVARREDALEALAGQIEGKQKVRATVLPADLAVPSAPLELFESIRGIGLDVDILVNNAGFGLHGEFLETDIERELRMIQVNVTALVHLTKLFAPPMVHRHRGGIMNVASVAGLFPGPYKAIYYASKAFVLSFSESLAEELRDTGVSVSALCPGPTTTEFHDIAGGKDARLMTRGVVADARSVAEFGYNALQRGVRVAVPGVQNKLLVQAKRIVPRGLVSRLARKAQETG
jgi:short-subunit dehydrogenase